MAHGPWVGNLGYVAFATEATVSTAVTPTVFNMIEEETLSTNYNLEDQDIVFGNNAQTYSVLAGQRSHKGDITMVMEPDTAAQAFDMLLTRGTLVTTYTFTVTSANATVGATYTNNSVTFTVTATISSATTLVCTSTTGAPAASGTLTKSGGSGDATISFASSVVGPYQWPFTLSGTTLPKSKTVDISTGNIVKRFVGVQASKVSLSQSKNQLTLKCSVSALGSFQGGLIASISGGGPYTIVFDTTYDTNPTAKLVVSDLIRFYHQASGATVDATIASIVDAKTITTATNPSPAVANDMVYLRPATVSLTTLSPCLWGNTQFCFGSTAAGALTATQTALEQGSMWEIDYGFESDDGAMRSGSMDPAALVRMLGKPSLNIKKFFDVADDVMNFNNLTKSACVVRHYVYGATTYEVRVTINHLVTDDPLPKIKSKSINLSDIKYKTQYDSSDAQIMDVKVINGLASLA